MYRPVAQERPDRYRVSVEEYVHFRRHGYLIVHGLVPKPQVEVLRRAMDKAFRARFSEDDKPLGEEELRRRMLLGVTRMHMLHSGGTHF